MREKIYRVMNYDLWGNDKDGYDVNDVSFSGVKIHLNETDSDKNIIRKLKEKGYVSPQARFSSFKIEGEYGYFFYIDYETKNKSMPFCELRPEGN